MQLLDCRDLVSHSHMLTLPTFAALAGAAEICSVPLKTVKACYNEGKRYSGSNIYDSYPSKGEMECCEECERDKDLCAGFTVRYNANSAVCSLMGSWDEAALVQNHGNCSSMQVRAFPASDSPPPKKAPKGAKNVLFLVADDMRPSIGPYKLPYVHTPNLDRIVNDVGGIAFSRAYIQQSYCAPSRNSFMSGR